ncbi:PA domain-containing protein [Ditylenchus destructor]|nr:PA domain-containing protein [Ditylenchus destructor]
MFCIFASFPTFSTFVWKDLLFNVGLILLSYIVHAYSLEEGLFFLIEKPSKLNYVYQINPSYHIGAKFPPYTLEDVAMVYADPPNGCTEFTNARDVSGEVVLIERGDCPFIDKVLNAEKAGARIAIVTDSAGGSDDFIDMITDDTDRKANIPAAYLPGVSGKRIREYFIYEEPMIWIQIPLNYTTKALRDVDISKPPWELW